MISPLEHSILDGKIGYWLNANLTINGDLELNSAKHLVLPQHNDAVTPTLAFGDGDTGFYESSDDVLRIAFAGALKWALFANTITGSENSSCGLRNETSTATNPTLIPGKDDEDTGIGRAGTDALSLIAGGVEGHRVTEAAGAITHDLTGAVNISRWESKEVFLNENVSNIANKPSLIDIGLFKAYSMPEYAASEELLFSMRVPHDWDGITNPYFVCPSIITVAEDVDDKYQFQLEWQSADVGSVFPVTTQETLTDEVTITDGTQYRGEILAFELDATTLVRGQNLQMRLRRIAASSSSVTGEIAIPHWDTRWKCNRIGTESIQGY